jgi:hypothetical protein
MQIAKSACAFAAVLALACSVALAPASAQDQYKAQIDALRKAMEKYKDYKVAIRDLYLSTIGCVHYAGEKIPDHMVYAKGAMGVHFVNLTIKGPPDPMKPNVLIYEPVGKNLRLVAVEWLVPHARHQGGSHLVWPEVHGPDGGARAAHPEGVRALDLHAWLFKDNPLGMFGATNPKVNCKGYAHELLSRAPNSPELRQTEILPERDAAARAARSVNGRGGWGS